MDCLRGIGYNLLLNVMKSISNKDKDKDKEALFNVAFLTDNISS